VTVRLDPDDVELIARRVLALVRAELDSEHDRLVDARALAQLLGVTRGWVYAHAEELHAVRLGGRRGRLRFDLARVIDRENGSRASRPRRRTRAAKVMQRGANLLPIDP
jgi:predicted DNA-binding transcriptional regulator AlpA